MRIIRVVKLRLSAIGDTWLIRRSALARRLKSPSVVLDEATIVIPTFRCLIMMRKRLALRYASKSRRAELLPHCKKLFTDTVEAQPRLSVHGQ
jgi:hypothetical protein